jgi:hypothetical protein
MKTGVEKILGRGWSAGEGQVSRSRETLGYDTESAAVVMRRRERVWALLRCGHGR